MKKLFLSLFAAVVALLFYRGNLYAVTAIPTPTETPVLTSTPSATVTQAITRTDITQKSEEVTEPLLKALDEQVLGSILPYNPIKYAIRNAVKFGVPVNTIVLLLLLPGVATLIAGARHIIGIRGFGIFMPAALSVTFLAIGPFIGIGLFLVIVAISTFSRMTLRKYKVKLQYLPRMALILLFVVLGVLLVLFLAPFIHQPAFNNILIFPVLILVLLAEDFNKVQIGKNAKIAVKTTLETLILALSAYVFMVLSPVRTLVLLHPEIYIISLVALDILMGRYIGLRVSELLRFRKIITK